MPTVRPKDTTTLGLSPSGLHRAARAGRLDWIARGLYRTTDAPAANQDWIEAATLRGRAYRSGWSQVRSALGPRERLVELPLQRGDSLRL